MTQQPPWILPGRLVVDSNVLLSSLIGKRESPNRLIVEAIADDRLTLVACPILFAEFREVGSGRSSGATSPSAN